MTVPIDRVHFFTDEIQREIRRAANQIMPLSAGYRVTEIKLSPFPEPAQGQQVKLAELIGKVNRLRSSRTANEVRVSSARELLKATCVMILSERNPSLQAVSGWGLPRLEIEIGKVLTLVPPQLCRSSQDATQKVLEKLSSLSQNLELTEPDTKRAGVAVWAALTLTMYLIDSHQPPMWQTPGSRWP